MQTGDELNLSSNNFILQDVREVFADVTGIDSCNITVGLLCQLTQDIHSASLSLDGHY
jgi:hypothetical protein